MNIWHGNSFTRKCLQKWFTSLLACLTLLLPGFGCQFIGKKIAPNKTNDNGDAGVAAAPASSAASNSPDKAPFVPENLTVLFPLDTAALAKAQSLAQVVDAVSPQLVPLLSLMDNSSYHNLLTSVLKNTADSNPLSSGVNTDILKISSKNWFVVGLRFDACDFRQGVPVEWILGLPEELQFSVCTPAIRLVVQPFGLRAERTPKGAVVNAWAVDDKALHLAYNFHGDLPVQHRNLHAKQKLEFSGELAKLLEGQKVTQASFVALVEKFFKNKDAIFASRQKTVRLINLARKLRSPGKGGRLSIPYSARPALVSYKNFIATELVKVADLEVVTHVFATSGMKPSTENSWAFGTNIPSQHTGVLAAAKFSRRPLRSVCLAQAAKSGGPREIVGPLKAGDTETFSNFPGDAAAIDEQLLQSAGAAPKGQDCLLAHSMVRNFVRRDGNSLVGDFENTLENPAADPLRKTLSTLAQEVENPMRQSIATQPCVSCHIVDGVRDIHKLAKNPLVPVAGNRLVDENLITEQSKPTQVWNLRMLGYFGRSPSLAARTVMETQMQVERFNRIVSE